MNGRIIGLGPLELVFFLIFLLIRALPWILLVVLAILAIRWFLRQERERKDPERVAVRRSLGEVLRSHRERCKMTQELVAEKIGVSRQAVSKWESGAAEPSTSNLIKVARLYGVDPADLLREVKE
ncbi:MAG TPA: helix-turn-helix domain-containing protein [Candidatus Olsenella avicola]|uniref:helix-turn-helix domain-containing protein n=1 Tax=Olsenella sp. An285 TaxID=1965621 RepID=UPI000B37D1D6|nr:helix-turn-helix transcriptional regulator [Olsenella sp. An285]OUO47867.1 hypothetical protein B5F79_03370 [Olsenella sp. An285]HIY50788.1 helix-turn-helix domain-containing protein [Candidatus Olsenella avicola]